MRRFQIAYCISHIARSFRHFAGRSDRFSFNLQSEICNLKLLFTGVSGFEWSVAERKSRNTVYDVLRCFGKPFSRNIVIALAFLAFATIAHAQVTKTVLPNGLTLIVKPEAGGGLVAMEAFVKAGGAQERDVQAGIGNLVARVLLSSTINRSPQKLAMAFEEVGGAFRTDWTPDFTEVSAVTTKPQFDEAANILADVLQNADFNAEIVRRTQEAILAEIKRSGDDVSSTAYVKLLEALYKDSPYRRPKAGYATSVRRLTRDDLVAFYKQYYVPNNMIISVAGDVTAKQVMDRFTKAFASAGEPVAIPQRPFVDEILEQPITRISERDIPAAYIMLGYLAPGVANPDFPALTVASAILGQGKASRLFVNIREKRGIGYEIGSMYPIFKLQSHIAAMLVTDLYKSPTPGRPPTIALQEAKDALENEMTLLKDQPVTDEELTRAKRYIIGSYALRHQRLRERAYHLAWMETLGVGYKFDQDFDRVIENVTKVDIQRVAKKYFTNYALVLTLPKESGGASSAFGR